MHLTKELAAALALGSFSFVAAIDAPDGGGCIPPYTSTPSSSQPPPPQTTYEGTSLPESCTFKPTQTFWSTSGCDIPCTPGPWCIADAAVTLSCGCPRMQVEPTTTTLCPTATSCWQCTTGWGIITITEPCPTATPV